MAEAQQENTEQTADEIRTAADLKWEELTKRLDSLEAENRELKEANKGLWAAAHSVEPEPVQESVIPQKSEVSDVDVLFQKLGVN